MTDNITIGTLAKTAGVNVETIRYYQRIGLINEPEKPAQGYRRYSAGVADHIRFVKRAQELGFTLNEITDLLSLDKHNCSQAREIAEHKCELIRQRVNDLKAMQNELEKLVATCRSNSSSDNHCAIIETLTKKHDSKQRHAE